MHRVPRACLASPLATTDSRQQMDLAVRANRFEPTVLIDLTVHRHGDSLFELRPHLGEAFTENAQELADVGCLEVEFFGPASELFQVAR